MNVLKKEFDLVFSLYYIVQIKQLLIVSSRAIVFGLPLCYGALRVSEHSQAPTIGEHPSNE